MSDKPLAEGIENWAKKLEAESEIEIAQHLRGTILLIKDFVREHLTEHTEPSRDLSDLSNFEACLDYVRACAIEGALDIGLNDVITAVGNAERRRIRELLVGKERA